MTAGSAVPTPLRRGAALCALAAVAALAAAAPAAATKGDDAAEAREVVAELAAAVAAKGGAIPQVPRDAAPRPPETRTAQAVTATAAFTDAAWDASHAPDLLRMLPATSDDGRLYMSISLDSNTLIVGEYVATFINADGNALTGTPTFDGADVAVTLVGEYGPYDAVGAARWDGDSFEVIDLPSLTSSPSGTTDEVWSANAAELGLAPGTRTTLAFGSMYSGAHSDYFDFAPEAGRAPFAFTTGALAPPPPPPPAAAPSPAPIATPARPGLSLRGFRLTRHPGALRMRIRWARATGRVTWNVRLTARAGGRRMATSVRGSGRAGARTVTRTMPLPRRWRGARVKAQLVVRDGSGVAAQTRSIRIPRGAR